MITCERPISSIIIAFYRETVCVIMSFPGLFVCNKYASSDYVSWRFCLVCCFVFFFVFCFLLQDYDLFKTGLRTNCRIVLVSKVKSMVRRIFLCCIHYLSLQSATTQHYTNLSGIYNVFLYVLLLTDENTIAQWWSCW